MPVYQEELIKFLDAPLASKMTEKNWRSLTEAEFKDHGISTQMRSGHYVVMREDLPVPSVWFLKPVSWKEAAHELMASKLAKEAGVAAADIEVGFFAKEFPRPSGYENGDLYYSLSKLMGRNPQSLLTRSDEPLKDVAAEKAFREQVNICLSKQLAFDLLVMPFDQKRDHFIIADAENNDGEKMIYAIDQAGLTMAWPALYLPGFWEHIQRPNSGYCLQADITMDIAKNIESISDSKLKQLFDETIKHVPDCARTFDRNAESWAASAYKELCDRKNKMTFSIRPEQIAAKIRKNNFGYGRW